jgi:hypothetical protein
MSHYLFIALLLVHGLIHLLGFVHAYRPVPGLGKPMPRRTALLWLLAALLFIGAATLLIPRLGLWWWPAIPAVALSQALIIGQWRDARYGTLVNGVIALAVVAGATTSSFRKEYRDAAQAHVARTSTLPKALITEADLASLPDPVQRYVRASGAAGTSRPHNMRIVLEGAIRKPDGPWLPFTTTQVNTFDIPSRHFWMDAVMMGLPTKGLHAYENGHATMRIKLAGLLPVMSFTGPELDTSETVTWFNDLCLFAPGALLDPRITWAKADDRSALATFTFSGITVHALLVFDEQDRLVKFISDDRYSMSETPPRKQRFEMPESEHRMILGRLLPGRGEMIWHLPQGPFTYGRFTLKEIAYDVES